MYLAGQLQPVFRKLHALPFHASLSVCLEEVCKSFVVNCFNCKHETHYDIFSMFDDFAFTKLDLAVRSAMARVDGDLEVAWLDV